MESFTTIIKKFSTNGEKTGWTYIDIPSDIASKLNPGVRQSFRVKGKLDDYKMEGVSLLPMGKGDFIMPLNATMRKALKKKHGASLTVALVLDKKEKQLSNDFIACLEDEPRAFGFFKTLTKSHQHYFSSWIESAKTEPTKVKRITQSVEALSQGLGYPEMIRLHRKLKEGSGL